MSNKPNRRPSSASRVAAARQPSGSRTVWIIVGVLVVVALAAIIAVAVTGSEESAEGGGASPSGGTVVPSGDVNFGVVEVTGDSLPPLSPGSSDPALGQTMPTVTGVGFDDAAMTIAPDGKPKIVMLLAHWCPHCQAEVPRIQSWLDANGMPSDVDLVAIATGSTSTRANFPPGDWLREEKWSVPTLVDDEQGTAGDAFGLSSFPFFVVVDGSGKVIYRTSGELSDQQWAALVDAARTGVAPSIGGGQSSAAN